MLYSVRRRSPAAISSRSEVCGSSRWFSQVPLGLSDNLCNCRLLIRKSAGAFYFACKLLLFHAFAGPCVFFYALSVAAIARLVAEVF